VSNELLRSRLIEDNLPLVRHVVLQVAAHFPRYVDRHELARAGALGLVEAAQRYDASRGVPFDRFAARRIRGAILDSVRAADWAPRSVRTLGRQLEQVEQKLASTRGTPATSTDVADALGVSAGELCRLRDRVYRSVVLALDHVVSSQNDEELSLVEMLADRTAVEPEEELETRELLGYLRDAVGLLPERHRIVIIGYFLDGKSSQSLAELLEVTESRISQLRSEALEMLRAGIEAQYAPSAPHHAPGRVARRKADYATRIGEASSWRNRLVS
jgi:RNA polymerase sigma factor for flagellar operon FliA